MKKIKYILITIICINICITSVLAYNEENVENQDYFDEVSLEVLQASFDTNGVPQTDSRAVVVFDRASKTVIYGKNENDVRAMASTTKIMTATILIENADLTQVVEVGSKASYTGGSRLGIKKGDKITLNDLLYGLMLCSRK